MKSKAEKREQKVKKARRRKIVIVSAVFAVAIVAVLVGILISNGSAQSGVHGDVLDLTELSMVMRNAEISNILRDADSYEGRKIKVNGYYYAMQSDFSDKLTHLVEVIAVDACCPATVFEFARVDGSDDFPDDGAITTIMGELRLQDQNLGFYIAADDVEW